MSETPFSDFLQHQKCSELDFGIVQRRTLQKKPLFWERVGEKKRQELEHGECVIHGERFLRRWVHGSVHKASLKELPRYDVESVGKEAERENAVNVLMRCEEEGKCVAECMTVGENEEMKMVGDSGEYILARLDFFTMDDGRRNKSTLCLHTCISTALSCCLQTHERERHRDSPPSLLR